MQWNTAGYVRVVSGTAAAATIMCSAVGCASSYPSSEYDRVMARLSTISSVAKPAWEEIAQARTRGEKLDSDYVVDIANLNFLAIEAGVDVASDMMDHRSTSPDAKAKLETAEKLMARMVTSGKIKGTPTDGAAR